MNLSLFSLVLLIVAGLDSMKNLPSIALLGNSMFFFFPLAVLFFLIPTALIAAKLSAAFPTQGGIYEWVKKAFGKKWALAAVWFQWINTMIWYPTMLSFIAAALAYSINPQLANNKYYLMGASVTLFWGLTWINLKGVQASFKTVNYCSVLGAFLPMGCLIGMGLYWLLSGEKPHIEFHMAEMLPSFDSSKSWVSLVALMASFLGIELSGVHVNEIDNPKKQFPRAAILAIFIIFLLKGLSSLSIAIILPKEEIDLVSGVMQVFHHILDRAGLSLFVPIAAFLIAIGAVGTMVNWLIAPAKGLLQAAEDGYLPPYFTHKNRNGVASRLLVWQAVLVTLISLLFLLPQSSSDCFWLLTALSTEVYMGMYLLLFAAALTLHAKQPNLFTSFIIPTKSLWSLCICGVLGSLTTMVVSFFPISELQSPFAYFLQILIGNIGALIPLLFLIRYSRKSVAGAV